jgi:hypothetical protein
VATFNIYLEGQRGGKSLERQRPTDARNRNTEYNPHLVVTGPEIADVRRLKIAHFRTALLLCVTGLWILLCVLPAMMQQQQHSRDKENDC